VKYAPVLYWSNALKELDVLIIGKRAARESSESKVAITEKENVEVSIRRFFVGFVWMAIHPL